MFANILQNGLYAVKIAPGATDAPILWFLAIALIGYLLGSINSAVLFSRLFFGADIRTKGSGNAGLTNMFRIYGKGAAGLTLLGDILKTVLSILIAGIFFGFNYVSGISVGYACYIAALFCIIGHIKPIYYGFRGGKGVLCCATAVLVLAPIVFLVLFASFALIVYVSRYISLGSIVVAGLLPIALQGYMQTIANDSYDPIVVLFGFIVAVIVIYCHRSNLGRLWRHEENKFSFHRNTDKKDAEK